MIINLPELYNKNAVILAPLLNEIKKHVETGYTVLDLGSGTGVYIKALEKQIGNNGRLICVDNNNDMILYCKRKFRSANLSFKKLKAEKLSSLGEKVDVIFASLVLQFTKEKKVVSEIRKCLKRDGKLIFAIPLYRTGINIGLDGESKKFKIKFEKNLKEELNKIGIKEKPKLNYTNFRDKFFMKLLQKNRFSISEWNILPLRKDNLVSLLEYYKIPWRSAKMLNKPFSIRYKILSNTLKKTFKGYPNFTVKRYYLIAVAKNMRDL